jgi:sugar phosphate isomerase/epimerase
MEIGFLTAPFADVEQAIEAARATGVRSLELAHDDVDRVRAAGLEVAALARYHEWAELEPHVRLAAAKGVPAVSTLAGFAEHRGRLRELLGGAVELAGDLGVRLAFENWYRTNLRTLDDWRAFFAIFPQEHVGLVFDPSHLEWQGIDWRAALAEFRDRIAFAHAKDVAYDESGNWRYVLPGRGVIDWSEFDYDGFVSVEHEDDDYGPAEGIARAVEYLRRSSAPSGESGGAP